MKTGNTGTIVKRVRGQPLASMEPGHEDREYYAPIVYVRGWGAASMEPGHEDREYQTLHRTSHPACPRLNGARS